MGIGLKFPCCNCLGEKIWRVSISRGHWIYPIGVYESGSAKAYPAIEFTVTGTVDGFPRTEISWHLWAAQFGNFVTLERLTGDDWKLTLERNGLGAGNTILTNDFDVTSVADFEFDFSNSSERIETVVTVMPVDVTRPADFLWFPGRANYLNDLVCLQANKPAWNGANPQRAGNPLEFLETALAYSASPLEWTGVSDRFDITVADQTPTYINTYPVTIDRLFFPEGVIPFLGFGHFGGWGVVDFYPTETPFIGNIGSYDGSGIAPPAGETQFRISDSNNPPLTEKLYWSELPGGREGTTFAWAESQAWYAPCLAFRWIYTDETDPIFDPGLLNSGTILEQTISYMALWDTVRVIVQFRTQEQPAARKAKAKIFAVNEAGEFSGEIDFETPEIDPMPVSGKIEKQNYPADLWTGAREVFAGKLNTPRVWFPEYYATGDIKIVESPFHWHFQRGAAIYFFGCSGFQFTAPVTVSGANPNINDGRWGLMETGLGWAAGIFGDFGPGPYWRLQTANSYEGTLPVGTSLDWPLQYISGTPSVNESGFFRLVLDHITNGVNSPGPITYRYKSKRYFWKVGLGSLFLVYPEPYHNGASPPENGFDWRFEGGADIDLPATVDAGTPAYAFELVDGDLPPGASLNATSGLIEATSPPNYISKTGTCQIKVTDDTAAEVASPVYTWQYFGLDDLLITYPSPWSNTATPPSGANNWRIDGSTGVLTPYSIDPTVTGGQTPYTFSLESGSLPPYANLNTATGAIYTTGITPLDSTTSGSCVIRVTDDNGETAVSGSNAWEYIGT